MYLGTVGGLVGGMQRGIGFWFCRCYRTPKLNLVMTSRFRFGFVNAIGMALEVRTFCPAVTHGSSSRIGWSAGDRVSGVTIHLIQFAGRRFTYSVC